MESLAWVDDCREFAETEVQPLLEALAGAPSINPPGNEGLAAEPLVRFLQRHGLPYELQETEPGRPNVVARAGRAAGGRHLALCSHLDVVSPGDPKQWSGDPFVPRLQGDLLFGRGACDAKGSLAAMAVAAAFLHQRGIRRGTVSLAAVCGEERGGTGAKFLVKSGFRADGVIIGEPTSLSVQIGHKGRVGATVRVAGRGGHASNPAAAQNPILKLAEILPRLDGLASRIAMRTHPVVGAASLAPTQVSSGETNAATIPAEVIVTIDRRLIPGEEHAEAAAELEQALAGIEGASVEWFQGAYPYVADPDDPVVRACLAGALDVTGLVKPLRGFPATCDQYVFGRANMPTVILGPGDLVCNRTHAPDEYISLREVHAAVTVYTAIAARFLEESP